MKSPGDSPVPVSKLRTWAEIDCGALVANARACARFAGDRCRLLAVIKANGYGHGIREVTTALAPEVWGFGVATVTEAEAIGDAIAEGQAVLILGPLLPSEREAAVSGGFSVEVSNAAEAEAFAAIAKDLGRTASVHINIDTGMGRMGALPGDTAELVKVVRETESLRLDGIATHFPSADDDVDFTTEQIEHFHQLVDEEQVEAELLLHAANSAGLLAFSKQLGFANLVRPGLALYGVSPLPDAASQPSLKPVMSLKSRVTLVRELPAGHGVSYGSTFVTERPTAVATIGIGYGDGYPRHLSGSGAEVLIHGQRCPLLGRVTMDQIMVDVSGLERPTSPGDEVVLIGASGDESIDAGELAEKAGTIPWEILTGITNRVERVYV